MTPTHAIAHEWLIEYSFADRDRERLEQALQGFPDVYANPSTAMRLVQRQFAAMCPAELIDHLFEMRTNASGPSVILVHNGPRCSLPPTPLNGDSRGTHGSFAQHGYLMGMMMQLGHLVSHIAQKRGALIADVVPRPGFERSISNAGSAQALDLHVEDVHLENGQRPSSVGLLCLRPDPERRAETLVVNVRDILPLLDAEVLRELRQTNFVIEQSESFAGGPQRSKPMPVLSGGEDLPEITVEFNTTRALTAAANAALESFKHAARQVTVALKLEAWDLLIVCNRRTLHGRGVFSPRFEPGRENRWLLRLSVVADPYLIRDSVAPGGVRILEVTASELRDQVIAAARVSGLFVSQAAITLESARGCLLRYDEWLNATGARERPLVDRLRTEFAVFAAWEIAAGRLLVPDCLTTEQRVALAIALVWQVNGDAVVGTALWSGKSSVQDLMKKMHETSATPPRMAAWPA